MTDRFFGPQLRGFDIRGIGPRIERTPYNTDGTLGDDGSQIQRRARRPRLLHGPARARIPDQFGASEPGPAAVGLCRRRLGVEADHADC